MDKIYFSSTWEDIDLIRMALKICADDTVLSIAAAGDNILNLLLEKPRKIIALDANTKQISLSKFKSLAVQNCSHEELLSLLEGPNANQNLFEKIDAFLKPEERLGKFLSAADIKKGLNNIGLFEKLMLPFIRTYLKFGIRDKTLLLSGDAKKQKELFGRLHWWIELLVFGFNQKFIYHPFIRLARSNFNNSPSLKENLKNFFLFNDFSKNWYLQKAYFGTYKTLPPYLRRDNLLALRQYRDRVTFVQDDMMHYLDTVENQTIDKINYSDIFDWCQDAEFETILNESHRVLSENGLILYREVFVSRNLPDSLRDKFRFSKSLSTAFFKEDKTPLYPNVVILKKISPSSSL